MTTRKAQKKIPSCLIVLLAIIVTVFLIIFFGICYLKEHKFYKSARDYASALSIEEAKKEGVFIGSYHIVGVDKDSFINGWFKVEEVFLQKLRCFEHKEQSYSYFDQPLITIKIGEINTNDSIVDSLAFCSYTDSGGCIWNLVQSYYGEDSIRKFADNIKPGLITIWQPTRDKNYKTTNLDTLVVHYYDGYYDDYAVDNPSEYFPYGCNEYDIIIAKDGL